eukprot:8106000-Pyramimonas_sp.AAC.1
MARTVVCPRPNISLTGLVYHHRPFDDTLPHSHTAKETRHEQHEDAQRDTAARAHRIASNP